MNQADRVKLMKFVCSFAWADLDVGRTEREFVLGLVDGLGLDATERLQVNGWLQCPPNPDEVDPQDVPEEHRGFFLSAARALVERDGKITPEEAESLALFEQHLQ